MFKAGKPLTIDIGKEKSFQFQTCFQNLYKRSKKPLFWGFLIKHRQEIKVEDYYSSEWKKFGKGFIKKKKKWSHLYAKESPWILFQLDP